MRIAVGRYGRFSKRKALYIARSRVRELEHRIKGWPIPAVLSDNLACGGAWAASGGFFYCDNVPPWDTWVCYGTVFGREVPCWRSFMPDEAKHVVLSWIPRRFVAVANAGIDANPENCLVWLPGEIGERICGVEKK